MSTPDFKTWLNANEDRLNEEYMQMIEEMQDSYEHKAFMRGSDKCFEEWCESIYEQEQNSTKAMLEIVRGEP